MTESLDLDDFGNLLAKMLGMGQNPLTPVKRHPDIMTLCMSTAVKEYKKRPREDRGPAGFGQVTVDGNFANKIVG